MCDTPKDDEAKFNETLKRMLDTPPKPHKSQADKATDKRPPEPKPHNS
jgi:hypothetical protein